MLNDILTGFGGGIIVVVIYVIISNTLWLLLGSRLLRSLPGVDVSGNSGTLKIAVMLVFSALGGINWCGKFLLSLLHKPHLEPSISSEISKAIRQGERIVNGLRNKIQSDS